MEIRDEVDYHFLLRLLDKLKEHPEALHKLSLSNPEFRGEGILGFTRTYITVETTDLKEYTLLYEKAFSAAYLQRDSK